MSEQRRGTVSIWAENVGGIDETSVEFDRGVTVLEGRNASNRTSLLQAIVAALGSDDATLRGGTDHGRVELALGDETYTRTFERRADRVSFAGDPYLDDPLAVELFALLLESNEARRAVERGENLRDIVMEPVDVEGIRAEIEDLVAERRDIEGKLEELDELEHRLPSLEEERRSLEDEIETVRSDIDDVEAGIEDADTSLAETKQADEVLEELMDQRSSLESIRFEIRSEKDSIEALREERAELEDALRDHSETSDGELDDIDAEIEGKRRTVQELGFRMSKLQTIVEFNEELLEDEDVNLGQLLQDEAPATEGSLTDSLVDDDTVVCWTCRSDVDKERIETTNERLRDLRRRLLEERDAHREKIEELEAEQSSIRERRRERERIERELDQVTEEIERRERNLDDLRDRRGAIEERVEDLEAEVSSSRDEGQKEVLELHKRANELEFELGRLEDDLADVRGEIGAVEERLQERDALEARRDELRTTIGDLRTRIEEIEREAVEQFNEHMDAVLDVLEYGNIKRIWMEPRQREVRRGRETVAETAFDLHVVRTNDEGTTYEDTVDHLSESEREVTGLVFALAGYLVHSVHEEVPFMLLDSLEAIDANRIARLVDYFAEYADYLVVALLPEDAAALDDEYRRIEDV